MTLAFFSNKDLEIRSALTYFNSPKCLRIPCTETPIHSLDFCRAPAGNLIVHLAETWLG